MPRGRPRLCLDCKMKIPHKDIYPFHRCKDCYEMNVLEMSCDEYVKYKLKELYDKEVHKI
jgi:hypothetical protein